MMQRLAAVAVLVLLVACPAWADFNDSFAAGSQNTELGTGTGASYSPGLWTVVKNKAAVEATGTTNLGISVDTRGVGPEGAGALADFTVRTGASLGKGTYQSDWKSRDAWYSGWDRTWFVWNYQNESNFYFITTTDEHDANWVYTMTLHVGYVQNGTINYIGSAMGTYTASSNANSTWADSAYISVTWDPANESISATVKIVNVSGVTTFDNTGTPWTGTGPNLWESGSMGAGAADIAYLSRMSFTSAGTPPSITQQPAGATKNVGESVTFTVTAAGDTPISYQWKKNDTNIGGATSSSYTISSVQTSDAGDYTCYVSNAYGNVTSNAATLTVGAQGPPIVAINEDFTDPTVIGSGSDASYVPGPGYYGWTVELYYCGVLPTTGMFGGAGTLRLSYSNVGPGGPDWRSSRLLSNTPCGQGDYTCRAQSQSNVYIGYQDANNYFFLNSERWYKDPFGMKLFGIGKVVNGVTTWLAADDANGITTQESDHYEYSLTWDPANSRFTNVTLVIKDSSDQVRATSSLGTVSYTAVTWTKGKIGGYTTGGLKEYDRFTFTPPNTSPVPTAGTYGIGGVVNFAGFPATMNLAGTVSDDGKPNPPATVTTTWSKTSGPGSVTFGNENALSTTATFSQAGTYVLRLTASDSQLSYYSETTVIANGIPSVSAGSDQTITLPTNQVSLSGSASDDGIPNPPGSFTKTWRKVFGPGTVTISDVHADNPTVTFTKAGAYQFQFSAYDGAATANDSVNVLVNPQPYTPPQVSDWSEDFTSSAGIIGTGLGGTYVAGANWTIAHGVAQVDTTYTVGGNTGQLRVGYASVGPNNGTPNIVVYNTVMGKGIYNWRGAYSTQGVVGYQDPNNYYLVSTGSSVTNGFNVYLNKVVAGASTLMGGAALSNVTLAGDDIFDVTIEWDPDNNLMRLSLKVYSNTGVTLKGSCTSVLLGDDLGGSDPDWKSGKFGGINFYMGTTDFGRLSFTNAPASLSDDFTASSIGSGSGGGYTAGANWTVAHGLVKETTNGTFGKGTGIVELGQSGGVGPNNGVPNTLLTVNNCGGGQYNYRGCHQTDFVFGYADDQNYYFAEVNSANRTVGGQAATRSFAIGKVAGGATTWLGHAGTFDTSDANSVYEVEVCWDTTDHKISGSVRKYAYAGGVETLNNIEAIDPFDDGNLRAAGKFGVREETSTVRTVDSLSFTPSFCDDSTAGAYDGFGGYKAIKGTRTGFFHLELLPNNRWMWITPDGYGFVAMGASCFEQQTSYSGGDPDIRDANNVSKCHLEWTRLKFNNDTPAWLNAQKARFRNWGLNYTGDYSFQPMTSVGVPTVKFLSLLTYAVQWDDSRAATGNIWYDLSFGKCPDVYNPGMQAYANSQIRANDPDPTDPTILAIIADETDNQRGFYPTHNHLGLALLVGKNQIGSAVSSAGYTGPMFTNYAKAAFMTYLQNKYGAIGNLNSAWGMSYADWNAVNNITYDYATYGDWVNPQRAGFPTYRQDLDYGITMFATQWATIEKNAREGWDNNHAFCFEISGAPTVMWQVADAFRAVNAYDYYMGGLDAASYDMLGGKPFMVQLFATAENDSPLKFAGTLDSYSKVNISGTDFLRVHVDGDNYWWGNSGTRDMTGFSGFWFQINGMNLPGKAYPGHARLRRCGNETGGGWWEAFPNNAQGAGTVDEWIAALNAMAPTKATFKRWGTYAAPGYDTQEERSQDWIAMINGVVNDQTPSGTYYRLGGEAWTWVDNGMDYFYEQRNFGFVSMKDNAYDGVEATTLGADATGGTWDDQAENYGDYITPIKNANMAVYGRILGQGSGGTAPSITSHPQSQTKNYGDACTFSVTADGTAPLSYQWKKDGNNISGATSSSYNIASVTTGDAGNYTCYVSNSYGNATSNAATLSVVHIPPYITVQPQGATKNQGEQVTFSVTAGGDAPLSYQWKKNGSNIGGATNSSYTITSVQTSDAGDYTCYVSNSYGNVTSNAATLTVNGVQPPTITQQPQSQTITLMNPVTFTVAASGQGTLTYQWKKGGSDITGATGTSYTINNVAAADAGDYTCAVTNSGGTTTSNAATLTVTNDAAVNGGFETVSGTPSMPTSWTFTSSNSCWSSNTNATYLRTGSRSLGCTNASGSSTVPVANDAAVTLIPGTYTISCYIKSNGAFGGSSKGFRLELLNSSNTVVANSATQKGTFSSWTLVTINYTVTATGTFHVRLDMIGKPSGTLYIDDVKLSQ